MTNGRTQTWGEKATLEIMDDPPRLTITIENDDFYGIDGLPVVKTGKRTGATIGYISKSCVTTPHEQLGDLPCQYWADPLFVLGGDSGSPVFSDYNSGDICCGELELYGILWGYGDEQGIYSPMQGVREDLGNLTTFDPEVKVSITGPSLIDQVGTYTWDTTVEDAEGTVTYQWSILWEGSSTYNNLGTSSSQDVSVMDDKDFTLRVIVTDSDGSDEDTHTVTVDLEDCTPLNPCQN